MGKRLLLVIAAGLLILGQFGDCMSAMAANQQSMKCCASMPCTPANQSHNCCKTMNAPKEPNMVLPVQLSLQAIAISSVSYERIVEHSPYASIWSVLADAQQHSPPELYTLYASLLI